MSGSRIHFTPDFTSPIVYQTSRWRLVVNLHNSEILSYNSQSNETRTYSFDVFDTFLLRACSTPNGVFERAFQLSPISRLFPHAKASYAQHRRQAEARARGTAKKKKGSSEVKIADIYGYFPFRLFGLDRKALPDLVAAEFEAEIDLCRANAEMVRQYSVLRESGARTGFISDTYWNSEQLAALLRSCHPGLSWDFLYASSESGTSKGEKLFATYLEEQGIAASRATHIGDNEHADIKGARRHGIATRHYPQASAPLTSIFQRESSAGEFLCPDMSTELDHGFRTLRRIVAARTPSTSPLFELGLAVVGPVLGAFDAFVADRVERLRGNGGSVAVAFLGRDGFLSHQIWKQSRDQPASYIALNRRVSVMGSAATLAPLADLLSSIPELDCNVFLEVVKILPPRVAKFFAQRQNGFATGEELADALPGLIDPGEIATLATGIRTELLRYLRQQILDFDDCTDLVLIDLGYSGSIQKALRRIFDLEGIDVRLHGYYLLTTDESSDDLADNDGFEGFISDNVVTPHVKRMLVRNIVSLEQMCCAATGSVRGHHQGEAVYEDDPQSGQQNALAERVQAGALAFAASAHELAPVYRLAPFSNLPLAARSAASILGRLLLLPTDDEMLLLGPMQHDLNLGTRALAPLLDGGHVASLQVVRDFPSACTGGGPPMWLAGSFSAMSPVHNFLYLLFGSNRLPPDIFADVKCGQIEVGLFRIDGSSSLAQVSCFRTGFGDIRVRIPTTREAGIRTIVVPIARLATEGLVAGPFLQNGASLARALQTTKVSKLPDQHLEHAGLFHSGRYYRATQDDGALIIHLPLPTAPVGIISIGLTPLKEERVLALQTAQQDFNSA
jgi:FMN phosphatase YigB (HAD superfamily)